MEVQEHARMGYRAPSFHSEAMIGDTIIEVSLSTFIHHPTSPTPPDSTHPWLVFTFIPAVCSSSLPAEVLAFQNCYDEFRDRNCNILFISGGSKQALWRFQSISKQFGRLGQISIPLASDPDRKIGKKYGVFIGEEDLDIRGMFILDGAWIVQQITLNADTVERSVLKTLRLIETYQAIARCNMQDPIGQRPDISALDDSKKDGPIEDSRCQDMANATGLLEKSWYEHPDARKEIDLNTNTCAVPYQLTDVPEGRVWSDLECSEKLQNRVSLETREIQNLTSERDPRARVLLSSPGQLSPVSYTESLSAPISPSARHKNGRNIFVSSGGSRITLDFADPMLDLNFRPRTVPVSTSPAHQRCKTAHSNFQDDEPPALDDVTSSPSSGQKPVSGSSPGTINQNKLHATLEAFRSMSTGLASPSFEFMSRKIRGTKSPRGEEDKLPGYFDVDTNNGST